MKTLSAVARFLSVAFIAQTFLFASDFVIPLSDSIQSMAIDASGKILVGQKFGLTRFHEDGTVDTSQSLVDTIALGVENDRSVLALDISAVMRINIDAAQQSRVVPLVDRFVLQPDGKIVGLVINPPPRNPRNTLSRFNSDGTLDPDFNTSLFHGSFFTTLALQENGQIIVAASQDGVIERYNTNGAPDASFSVPTLTPSRVNAITIQPDGKILIGGEFEGVGEAIRRGLVRLHPNGSIDSEFNPGSELTTNVHSLALQTDGKIIVAGIFGAIGGQPATNLARLNPDGTLDPTFQSAPIAPPRFAIDTIPLVLDEDGSVLVGSSNNLVRITNPQPATQSLTREGSTLTWLRGGSSPEVFQTRFHASLDGIDWTDLGPGQRVPGGWRLTNADIPAGARLRARGYVTGTSYFVDHVPGAPALYSHPLDTTVDFDATVTFRVAAKGLEPLNFQWFKNGQPIAGANSATLILPNVTGGDAGAYHAVVTNADGSSTSRAAQLAVIDPILVVQPHSVWINTGNPTNLSVGAVGSGLTYQWKKNGANIPGATSPSLEFPNATPDDTGKYQVIITGTYGTLESTVVTLRVNTILPNPNFKPNWEATTQWFPIQAVVAHNNELFMGGLFRMLDAPGQRDLVKIKADGSIDPLFAPSFTGGEIDGVIAIGILPSGQLLVGGNFMNVNGQSQPRLARLNRDGTLDPQFAPVIDGVNNGLYTQVASIELLPDGRILIGGGFASVNGQPRPGVAILLPDGALDETFNPDPTHAPGLTWGSIVQPSGKIIAYGWDFRRFLADGTADFEFTEAVTANGFQPIPLGSGQILVNSQQGIANGVLTLIDPEGNPDPDFKGALFGGAEAEQANGELLVGFVGESIPVGNTTNGLTLFQNTSFLLRMNLDGVEDPSFSPLFDNYGLYKAMRADGSMLFAGAFSNIAGISVPELALLNNSESATQSLTLNGSTATWLRSPTSPEVLRTTFEFSLNGVAWTNLGAGTRTTGGWKLDGLHLPSSTGLLRARGFFRGSIYDTTIEISNGIKLAMRGHQPQNKQSILNASGPVAARAILQISTDLREWTNLQTNSMTLQSLELTLTNQPAPHAFYRLLQTSE
jgi:uncharacterized delta-60 repeat protein